MANIRQDRIQLSIEINGVKAGTQLRELKTNARDLTRELDKLAPGTEEFVQKAEELRKVNNVLAEVRQSTKGVALALEDTRTPIQRLTDLFKQGAVVALAFFSTQRIIQWGREMLSWLTRGTAALEAQQRKTAIVFGDAIDIVQDAAAINAQALGVTETAYASLAAQIGDILIPMGFQREEAAKLSTDLTDLSGALSEWDTKQRSASEIAAILSKALTGERESLKELGIVITEADVQSRLLAKGQKELTGTALQQAKALINYELILERSKDAQTAFATNQESLARTGTRLTGIWNKFKEEVLLSVIGPMRSLGAAIADTYAPIKRQSDQVQAQQALFNVQIETLKKGNISQENRAALIGKINAQYKDYLPNLLTEKTSLEDISKIQDEVNQKFTQRILLLATEESLRDVSQDLIAAKKEELDLALRLSAAEKARQDLIATSAERAARSSTGTDRQGDYAIQLVRDINFEIEENKRLQAELTNSFEQTAAAAKELGLDITAIISGPTNPDGDPDPDGNADARLKAALKRIEERYRLEELIKIQSIENLRENDEVYEAERARIALETSVKIAAAQSELYKAGTLENLQLQQKAADDLATLQNNADKLTLDQRIAQVHREINARRAAIDEAHQEESISQTEYFRERELLEKESAIRIAQLRAQALIPDSAEARQAEQDILDKEKELNRLRLEASVKSKEEEIELSRQLAIQGLNDLFLAEEDLQKSREIINREADIRILETRLALYKQGTEEYIALENQLADLRRQSAGGAGFQVDLPDNGFFSTPEDRDRELEVRAQMEQAGLDITEQFAQYALDVKQQAIQEELQTRLDAISASEQAALEAAEGDAALQKKIRSDADRQRLSAEKQAAKERQSIARKEAVIQGALAFIKSLPNYVAAAAAAAATIFQIAQIDAQKFDKGGFTGRRGIYRDSSGHEVAGVVHANEYVIPKNVLDDPATAPVVNYLERVRRAKGGYVDGGFTSVNTRPVIPVTSLNGAAAAIDNQKLDQMIAELREIKRVVAAWPREMRANVVLTDLERKAAELNYIREQSVV